MVASSETRLRRNALLLSAIGLLLVGIFQAVGAYSRDDYTLDLGSLDFPAPAYLAFISLWLFFGLLAATALTAGLTALTAFGRWAEQMGRLWQRGSDRTWIVVGSLAAFVIPVVIQTFVFDGAPVSDDESAYRFSADLLASGRLWVESPPEKLFFDRQFMINDGRFYSQYFLGWPALMVPALWLGVPQLANPFYSAITVPAVFLITRQLTGSSGARLALLLVATSPMLMVAAATQMSHTSCLAALAWLGWLAARARAPGAKTLMHGAVGLAFSLAFFIRPTSAIGLGVPLVVWWLIGVCRTKDVRRVRALAAFALPALLMASAFFAVNKAQNGSFTKVSYVAALDYAAENGYRFTTWSQERGEALPLDVHHVGRMLNKVGVALLRLNAAMFGWPSSFVLALLAWGCRRATFVWYGVGFFLLTHVFAKHVGIDVFGPSHYHEITWAFIILTVVGIERSRTAITTIASARAPARSTRGTAGAPLRIRFDLAPNIAFAVFVALALFNYVPPRLKALHTPLVQIAATLRAPERAGLDNAIVFAPTPLTPAHCTQQPSRHWVYFRPNNDPDLRNRILWVNHLGAQENTRLMRAFPRRKGAVLVWQACQPSIMPLDAFRAHSPKFNAGLELMGFTNR